MTHEHQHRSHNGHSLATTPGTDRQPEMRLHKDQHGNDSHSMYDKHTAHRTENFLTRFWLCVVLTIPILLLSNMIQELFGFHLLVAGDDYFLLCLGATIYCFGGWPFLKGMVAEIKHKSVGMMTLVALAISVAFVYSVATIFGLKGMDFYWELATLIDIMLLGHWLEMRSQMAASKALQSLVELLPTVVHVERNGQAMDIQLKDLNNGEIVIIKPGEKVPADGFVTEGHSAVNESMLTGESVPVAKEKDSKVIGGSINGDGAIKVKVTGVGGDSYLTKVINVVHSAQIAKSKTQNLADKVAKWLTIISVTIGAGTFIYWIGIGKDLSFAVERLVTVMVTSCPHALGVAIPLVVALSTAVSATHGLLIRNRTAFETSRNLTTIIFDKTGTLTKGSHEVQHIIPFTSQYNENEILQYAAAVQQNSEHYIARGILRKLKEKKLDLWKSEGFQYMKGMGVSARVQNETVVAVGPNYFRQRHLVPQTIPGPIDENLETIIFLLINDQVVGIITLADSIRESSAEAITQLKKMNIKSFLLTGDNEKIAAAVANKLGMEGYLANVLPDEKQNKVKEFQSKGETVAMTGDGVNDAPALAQADVGIAIGSGTDVAAETADIILMNSDPKDVAQIISFARATYRKMIQNLVWAVGYNVVAIPLAAGVLYPYFTLSPAVGAILMSLSTVIVAINARLLRLNRLEAKDKIQE